MFSFRTPGERIDEIKDDRGSVKRVDRIGNPQNIKVIGKNSGLDP